MKTSNLSFKKSPLLKEPSFLSRRAAINSQSCNENFVEDPLSLYCLDLPFRTTFPKTTWTSLAALLSETIQTASGNLVSRKSFLFGSNNVHLSGRSVVSPQVILRGDLAHLRIGKYVILSPGVVLRPPLIQKPDFTLLGAEGVVDSIDDACHLTESFSFQKVNKKNPQPLDHLSITIDDYVFIGNGTLVEAASIESRVWIGSNCILGKRCILMQCCQILPFSTIPPDTVVPPFTVFGGSPASAVAILPEHIGSIFKDLIIDIYKQECVPTNSLSQ